MISMGDLDPSDHPGYFMLAELGAAIGMDHVSVGVDSVV